MLDVPSLFDLQGKRALVTGGSRGLGAEIAEGLAEAGASLFILARREQWLSPAIESMRERGFNCHGALCDVRDPAQADRAVEAAVEALGGIDILVNNAGITWGADPVETPLEKWQAVIDVNLTGAFLFCQRVGKRMIEQGSGRIINIASIAGLRGGVSAGPGIPGYAASKAGLMGLTRELAVRWSGRGVLVNAVAPGFFPSRMTEKVLDQIQQHYEARVPMQRIGRPGELKGVVVFLASAAASYITGQTIVVDGGASIA